MSDVFISYAREDEARAEKLAEALTHEGWSVWWDRKMRPGEVYADSIDRELDTARVVIVLWSAASVKSEYVRGEATKARNRDVLLPVRLDGAPLPTEFLQRQTIPAEPFAELAAAIRERLGGVSRAAELRYLDRLIEECRKLAQRYSPLHGIAEARRRKGSALLDILDDFPGITPLRHACGKKDTLRTEKLRDYDDILEAFPEVKRAALLGEPGSGKSTTLRKLASQLAGACKDDSKAPLPLLVALGGWTGDVPLARFLEEKAPEIANGIETLRQSGRLVLLLDGLNEIPTAARSGKAEQVRRLCQDGKEAGAIIVSCRADDYRDDLDLGLDTLTLEPLSPQRVGNAVRLWVAAAGKPREMADRLFWQLAGDEGLAAVLEKWLANGASEDEFWDGGFHCDFEWSLKVGFREVDLWRRHIPDTRSLLKLARNPFMLTMLYGVWAPVNDQQPGSLPKNRAGLFESFAKNLLRREGLATLDEAGAEVRLSSQGQQLLTGLTELAWRMQRDRVEEGLDAAGDFGVLTVAPREAAVQTLGSETMLKHALDSTLLEGSSEVRFRHQLLQEHFTARALESRFREMDAGELWPREAWWKRTGWEEAVVLLAGRSATDCTEVIQWLKDAQPERAADCWFKSGAEIKNQEMLLKELQAAWLPRLTGHNREQLPEARAAVGRALGRLGLDNRFGVGLGPDGVPEIDWVGIPAGTFQYQNEKKRRTIEAFRIARYPVTNAQFEAFVKAADGYDHPQWWEGRDDPGRDRQAPEWDEPNHPRETVSWHEAMAFCAWLSSKLKFEVRLPTEWEWERAARGTDGRVYPWGDQYLPGHANVREISEEAGTHYLGRTSAVGLYDPEGKSPEGVLDLSGNVWEWCLNEWENPKRVQLGGTWVRVLRGGSWSSNPGGARAGFRGRDRPVGRNDDVGFRVVSSSPIAER